MQQPLKSFTGSCSQISRVLLSSAWVAEAFDTLKIPKASPEKVGAKKYTAIWDTGATCCVIGERVVNECNLKPISITKVNTADGEHDASVYLISLFLPSRVFVPELIAVSGKVKGADMLIGMDVINQGDFAVSNFGGKTTITFRTPSCERIDFVKKRQGAEIIKQGTAPAKVGRNDPCPCGSGKKYKKCCGK